MQSNPLVADQEAAMNLAEALERIDAIHAQLARGEQYRGYRPLALAISGIAGLLAALLQPWVVGEEGQSAFVHYWVLVALACAAVAGGATVLGYVRHEDAFARRRTRTVLGQFAPCLFAGAVLTATLSRPEEVVRLPGLWALVYGLGVVASLPYLPRPTGLIAAWYLGWGVILLRVVEGPVPSGWAVGVPFGVGQLISSAVLYRCRPREEGQ
jgi:hypothetical protein